MVPSWAGGMEASLQSICLTSVVMNTMSSLAGSACTWYQNGGFQPPVTVPPPRPQWLYGDASCRYHVPTVPDSAGEAVGAAGAPDTGGSSGLPLPAFSGSPRRQLPAGLQETDFPFDGSSLGLCHGASREKKERGQRWACVSPWQGKKDRPPSAEALRQATCL